MTTINSLGNFLQAQGTNPSWREEFPVRFRAFVAQQEEWNAKQDARGIAADLGLEYLPHLQERRPERDGRRRDDVKHPMRKLFLLVCGALLMALALTAYAGHPGGIAVEPPGTATFGGTPQGPEINTLPVESAGATFGRPLQEPR